MTSQQILAIFADAATDPRFPAALGIAALAGLVRGFSGFGSALIYIPLVSAVYGPQVAAPTLLLIDTLCSLPFAIRVMPQCTWREVTPVSIGSAVAAPFGMMALLWVNPLILRWFIAGLVLVALVALVSGWRYHGRPTLAASLGVGASAGFGGGAVQIAAPPLLVFWLGGNNNAATVRANIMVYFIGQGALAILLYIYGGLFTAQTVTLSLLFGLPFAVLLAVGAFWFHGTSDLLYRRVAYVIIAAAGLISLPLFDALR
ncbi:MAG TPA: sulfite exporter TauE/SafE family protein [Pseudolabrys sp.]